MRYETSQEYIDYCYGKIKCLTRDYKNFKSNSQRNWRAEQDKDLRKKYPSFMEEQMKAGTSNTASDGKGTKKEAMKYTGDSYCRYCYNA